MHVKSLLDIGHRPADLHQSAIGMGASDAKPVGFCEINHRLIIPLAWAKGVGKLIRGQKVPVIGTGRLVKLFQQVGQFLTILQGQTDAQMQLGAAVKPADGRKQLGDWRHMAFEDLL
jgi:hypothetical protein